MSKAAGVLLLGERVEQGARRAEQIRAAIMSTAGVDERRDESQRVLGEIPWAGTRLDQTLVRRERRRDLQIVHRCQSVQKAVVCRRRELRRAAGG
jgi:hypothetical protein